MLSLLWKDFYNLISVNLHIFTIPVNLFFKSPPGD